MSAGKPAGFCACYTVLSKEGRENYFTGNLSHQF